MQSLIISTLAEYQTAFWVPIGKALEASGYSVTFVSCDTRSTEMLRTASLGVVDGTLSARLRALGEADPQQICAAMGIANPQPLITHERFAFGATDTDQLLRKLAGSLLVGEAAIQRASQKGTPIVVQELGGFLSVLGLHQAALAANVPSIFIEPSFFKGRMQVIEGSLSALKLDRHARAPVSAELAAYFAKALESGMLVVPEKDRRHYSGAAAKLSSPHNIRRLFEKSRDKFLLGAELEFGAIGHHVSTHLQMLSSSFALRSHYSDLGSLGSFLYYPLHVPGDAALTLRSPEYLDQLALLDFLCRHAPPDMVVATKEHPAMIGRVSSSGLKALKARYDRFAILPPTTNNYAILREADTIVTVNSKSGAEAGLLGKNVVVLGDAFYRDAPFAQPVDSLAELGELLASHPGNTPASARSIKDTQSYFAALWERTYPGELYAENPAGISRFAQSLQTALAEREWRAAPHAERLSA